MNMQQGSCKRKNNKKFLTIKGVKKMLEILVSIATLALFFYAIKLAFKITWGVAKIIAVILFTLALPLLVVLLFVAGGAYSFYH
jgi:hypothetical protein